MKHRSLNEIANEIGEKWPSMYFGAKPYWEAMFSLNSVTDKYGYDDGKIIVLYFLANAGTWKGQDAKRIKNELKQITK